MPGHKICAGANVENSMITDGCKIAGSVKHSILFAGVKVEAGAVVEDAVVMGRTTIKAGASVKHCIVAENVVIGECRQKKSKELQPSDRMSASEQVPRLDRMP